MEKFIPRLPPIVKNLFKAQQSMLSLKFEYSIFIYHYSKKNRTNSGGKVLKKADDSLTAAPHCQSGPIYLQLN